MVIVYSKILKVLCVWGCLLFFGFVQIIALVASL